MPQKLTTINRILVFVLVKDKCHIRVFVPTRALLEQVLDNLFIRYFKYGEHHRKGGTSARARYVHTCAMYHYLQTSSGRVNTSARTSISQHVQILQRKLKMDGRRSVRRGENKLNVGEIVLCF